MTSQIRSSHETALDNWTHAVQTYRAGVDLYTRVLTIRHRRVVRPLHRPTLPAFRVEVSPPPAPVLDELTVREREVALLIARGFSNRQIAQALVITQGTAANHVAHIIGKLGMANRTEIAAAVAARSNVSVVGSDHEPIHIMQQSAAQASPKHELRSIG
jgi:DNA-binding NarL/FixJ family response regulator